MSSSTNMARNNYRRKLLTTVSAVALMTTVYSAGNADAAGSDADRSPLWIELGWHFEDMHGLGDAFAPPFESVIRDNGFTSPALAESVLAYSYGGDGKITFQPDGSDWVFSASVRFGRAHGRKKTHEQHYLPPYQFTSGILVTRTLLTPEYADTRASNSESHVILDFQAGKEVGLGMLGSGNESELALGVRVVDLHSTEASTLHALPHITIKPFTYAPYIYNAPAKYFNNYNVSFQGDRRFKGVGPSIAWSGSTAIAGEPDSGELTLDWGANAAVLFGKQKTSSHHETKTHYFDQKYYFNYGKLNSHQTASDHARERFVIAPNVGGSLGISYRIQDFKVSLGYRGDFFFNAIDGGVDTRKSITRGFQGPYASISFGMSPF